MFLLDTNVISELRRLRPHGAVLAWLDGVSDRDLHLSAVSIGEFQAGVELTRDQDPVRAADIETWLDRIAATYNVLPVDAPVFRCWARLMHHQSRVLIEDALIAATAQVHDLIVVTRNIQDFRSFGVRTLDPFRTR
jgi:predicted nucleic acid-binding protein